MKFLFDLLPVILFFAVFYLYPSFAPEGVCAAGFCLQGGKAGAIYAATLMAIAGSMLQVGWQWASGHKVETMHWITLGILLVMGGATLFFHDERFIKWKPTLVNWLFAVLFLGSQWLTGKPFIQRMMEKNIQMDSQATWNVLNYSWAAFFFVVGIVNLWVAFTFSTEIWVNFKMFGIIGLTLIFVVLQAGYLSRHVQEPQPSVSPEKTNLN